MGGRALAAPLHETDDVARHARRDQESPGDSPATRLLDALGAGDVPAVLAACSETTTVSADNMGWSCRGRDEILQMLTDVRHRFPGLTFESRTRHVGFGLVIDEARVQDELFEEPETVLPTTQEDLESAASARSPEELDAEKALIHPMWDEPVTEHRTTIALWQSTPEEILPPSRLNLPVRVTVRHDDLQVHDISLSFPAALLKRALGLRVDPFEMSLSEIQSAFIAPVGAGFTTHELARPELTIAPPVPPDPEPVVTDTEPPRRRRRRLVPMLVLLLAVVAAGGWWVVQGRDTANQATPPPTTQTRDVQPSTSPAPSPSAPTSSPSSSGAPKVTQGKPSNAPSRKPNVTLKSDLAFGFDSARLSPQARKAIDRVARQVRNAGLSGTIYVDGYTDNLGSNAYGLVLSQRRATAVSNYLGSRLVGVPVTITSIGHGEADPIASNATHAGQVANRRVTITLPKP
jgi:outer membrane protein OmpA-like peptidoglycan-associated protein